MTLRESASQRGPYTETTIRTRLDDFSGYNDDVQCPLVQVLDSKLSTSQCRQQINLGLAVQVVSLSLESRVLLLLDRDDDISRNDSRSLITLSVEPDLLSTLHSLVDMNLQNLSLAVGLLSLTGLASVLGIHHLSSTLTFVTWLLDLLNHGTELT